MIEFKLKPESEFIELMKLLKVEQIAQTGGHAKIIIDENEIQVNGQIETQKRKKLRKGDIITYQDVQIKIV